jgi:very-short-patch-repair endonuclease
MNEFTAYYKSQTLDAGNKKYENTLLLHLSSNRVEIPDREYKFHPTRRWRFDFAYPRLKLAVEVEGGIWSGGRHTRGTGFEADCEKYNEAALAGWRIIRVSPKMVMDFRALEFIKRALANGTSG